MIYVRNIMLSLLFVTCISATCINKDNINNAISPSVFIILDAYLAVQVELAADKCFRKIDEEDLSNKESYESWGRCMSNFIEIEALLEQIKNNLEEGNINSLKRNSQLLVDLMILLGLDIPEELMDFVDGNSLIN